MKDKNFTTIINFFEVFMILELLIENWLSVFVLVAMFAAITWFCRDDAIFWADVQRVAKGQTTKKYFKK